jgi:hypothetical protein
LGKKAQATNKQTKHQKEKAMGEFRALSRIVKVIMKIN